MEGDFYINTIVSSGSELASYALSGLIFDRIGIKISYYCSFAVTIIGSILYIVLGSKFSSLVPIMLLFASFGVSSSLNICWNSNALLFPLVFTATTNGICNFVARGATILSPQFAEFSQPTPLIIICCMSILGGFLTIFLNVQKQSNIPK